MSKEPFMAAVRAWRESHPNREEAYRSVIPQRVFESMALEGDDVDLDFLRDNLALV